MTVQEDNQKNKIIDAIIDKLDEMKWGDFPHDDLQLRITFYGKYKIFSPEVKLRPKERKIML